MSERGAAVVVDAYSTGARLAPRFAAAGLPVVHVQSSPRLPDFYSRAFRAGDFVENVVHEGDLEATAARLAAHDPAFVVVGAEPGVPLADALSERLGLPSNGSAQSAARRDKNAMSEALRDAGLRTAEAQGGRLDAEKTAELVKGLKLDSPRGPIAIDASRDIVQTVYIRRVERRNGRLENIEFSSIPNVPAAEPR